MGACPVKASFSGGPSAPGQARSFVTAQLDSVIGEAEGPSHDDVVLITSELVTNAVRAGAGTIDVTVRATADRLYLDVTDDAAGWPQPQSSGTEDEGGRGLAIVDRLADSWSAIRKKNGKTVTAAWSRQP